MPSNPLLGMPVVVGISEAVIAMRSVVSLRAADCDASAPSMAKA